MGHSPNIPRKSRSMVILTELVGDVHMMPLRLKDQQPAAASAPAASTTDDSSNGKNDGNDGNTDKYGNADKYAACSEAGLSL